MSREGSLTTYPRVKPHKIYFSPLGGTPAPAPPGYAYGFNPRVPPQTSGINNPGAFKQLSVDKNTDKMLSLIAKKIGNRKFYSTKMANSDVSAIEFVHFVANTHPVNWRLLGNQATACRQSMPAVTTQSGDDPRTSQRAGVGR